jgi:uncharacterized membrane protein
MHGLDLLLRWIHILSAILLVGGTFFWRFVAMPEVGSLDEAIRQALLQRMRTRWAPLVMIGAALLLVSGLINAVRIILECQIPFQYHILVAVKLLLALLLMYVAAKLSGRSESAARFQQRARFWLNFNVVLAIAVVCLAGYMKMVDREKRGASPFLPQTGQNGQR